MLVQRYGNCTIYANFVQYFLQQNKTLNLKINANTLKTSCFAFYISFYRIAQINPCGITLENRKHLETSRLRFSFCHHAY